MKARKIPPLILMALIVPAYLLLINGHWKPTWDSAIYITVSRALATGHGYTYMGYSHTKYPFMFPLLLAPITGLFGYNFLLMRILIVLMGLGGIWFAFLLIREMAGMWIALAVMALTAASYPLMFEATRVLSDLPYMFFSMLALIFVRRYVREGDILNRSGVIASTLILTSYFTRGVGISLAAAAFLYLLLEGGTKRDFRLKAGKAAFLGITFFIPALLWAIRNQTISPEKRLPPILREGLGYGRELILINPSDPYSETIGFGDLIARLRRNVAYYEGLISNIVSGRTGGGALLAHIISAAVLIGLIYCLMRRRTIAEYYFPLYMLVYLAWPSWQGERFLVPVIPFIFYYILKVGELILLSIESLVRLKIPIGRRARSLMGGSLLFISVVFLVGLNRNSDLSIIRAEHAKPYYSKVVSDFLDVIDWIKVNTTPETIVISDRPSWVYLLSDRKTFSFPWVSNPDEVVGFIRQIGADYVIVNPISSVTRRYLVPTIKRYREGFEEVYRKGESVVYKVISMR